MQRPGTTAIFSLTIRLALMSFLLNLAVNTSGVFLPLYARSIGSSYFEIGLIASTSGIAFFLASLLFGRLSDIYGRLIFIRASLGLSAIAYLSQILAHTTTVLLIVRGTIGFFLGVTSVVVIAYTYENQKQIGNFISYGSLGLVFGTAVAAIVRDYYPLFLASAISSFLAFLLSFTLKEGTVSRARVSVFPLHILKANHKVYLAFFLRHLGANAIWAIFPLYLTDIGATKLWIAVMDIVNNGGQFIVMRIIERFNPVKMFRMGLLISALVFVIYGVANNYLQVVPVQVLLAISWSGMYMGALGYLFHKNPEHGTVSGLLYSTIYLSASIGPFLGGSISHLWGFVPVMGFGSGLTFLGFLYSGGMKNEK
jgi:MFS family permease